ncbi:MAG: hypothetical protein ACRDRL_21080 [Sciscionella sp.]
MTMDDATGEHYHMQFVEEEGIRSSFHGVEAVIRQHGLFSAIYTDRGSHSWFTPEVGGKVDKERPTQFGRAMQQLGIEMIAAYSPQARGRSERAFRTHQDRLVRELALAGITDMPQANRTASSHRPRASTVFSLCAPGQRRSEGDPVRALRAHRAAR